MTREDIVNKYPALFHKACPWYIRPGWLGLVEELCGQINALDLDLNLLVVKEKYGMLTVYHDFLGPERAAVNAIIDEYTERSTGVCEECGGSGDMVEDENGWMRTLCPEHGGACSHCGRS